MLSEGLFSLSQIVSNFISKGTIKQEAAAWGGEAGPSTQLRCSRYLGSARQQMK